MRFALIDQILTEARPGLQGICPGCAKLVIAKCGIRKIHHWAHRTTKTCDDWWEPETEWHRDWKNNYPATWQENFLPDKRTGEKNIADVCTDYGLVIEFQHSHLHPQEGAAREQFYKNMIWIVDGTRLKRDYPRFLKAKGHFYAVKKGIFRVSYLDECLPLEWIDSAVPVVFDFATELYCLFPTRLGHSAIITEIPRKAFIKNTLDGEWLPRADLLMADIIQVSKEIAAQQGILQSLQNQINRQKFYSALLAKRRRRF